MTNMLNAPIEVLETRYSLRVTGYALRRGTGWRSGDDGLIREHQFLVPAQASLLTERRLHAPWGLSGGGSGQSGRNLLNGEPVAARGTWNRGRETGSPWRRPGRGLWQSHGLTCGSFNWKGRSLFRDIVRD